MVLPIHSLLFFIALHLIDKVKGQLDDEQLLFADESFRRFTENMDKLDIIQSKIFGIKHPSVKQMIVPGNGTTQHVRRPEQLPYLFQGDMILTDQQMAAVIEYAQQQLEEIQGNPEDSIVPKQRTMTANLSLRWKKFPIPFILQSGVDANAILAGMRLWEQNTCITFKQVTTTTNQGSMLRFIRGDGCYSYVGRISNGPQDVSIGYGCTIVGIVAHEIGHALGLYHEQARYDRDSHVRVLTQNIQSGYANQFSKQSPSSMVTYGVKYDYGSVMHYDSDGFSANGRDTLETLDPNYQSTIGQRNGLSFSDAKKVNFAYCNGTCSHHLQCEYGGYTDPKDCSRCRCTEGLGGTLCNEPLQTTKNCGTLSLTATSGFETLSQSGTGSCNFMITAPSSRKILIQMDSLSFPQLKPCGSAFLEIRYVSDLSTTGARFCGRRTNQILSETNKVMVLYRGSRQSSFTLRYRYGMLYFVGNIAVTSLMSCDPATPVETTINTERPTQVPTHPPTSPPTRPTLTWPPTATPTEPLTTWLPTWSPTVPPTTQPPTQPPLTPPTWPPPQGGWSEWSQCSAQCGGCGIQIRHRITSWSGEEIEARYCNMQACSGRRCCFPFLYIRSGLCVRAINEDGVTIDPNTETRTLPPLHKDGVERNVTGRPHKKLIIKSATNKHGKGAAGGRVAEEVEEFEGDDTAQLLGSDSRKDPFYYYYYYYYYDDERNQANNTNANNN